MTALGEQIGQLFMLGFSGTSVSTELAALLEEYRPGGLILFARNLEHVEQILTLTNELQRLSSGSPFLISIDQEGGRVSRLPAEFTIFPACETLGLCGSADLVQGAATVTASELRAVGINMNMAPVLDVNSNPDNPIIGDRAFSADPVKVAQLGRAMIKGLQGNRVAACGKHFPGHGDTIADSHKELPVVPVPRERLDQVELLPFRRVLERSKEKPAAIMTAHVLYPSLDARLPATLSPAILTGLLREDLRFGGLIITDDLEMHAIIDHYGVGEAAIMAIEAGADVLLICKDPQRQIAAYQAVRDAVKDGRISPARLESSLSRIARAKDRFVHPYVPGDLEKAREIVGSRSHKTVLATITQTGRRRAKAPA